MSRAVRWTLILLLSTLTGAPGQMQTPRPVSDTRPILFLDVGHSNIISKLAYSPDGGTLMSASWDDTARLWDAASGRLKAVLEGHTGWVRTAAYSPDGKMLATASEDSTVRLWDARTGQLKFLLREHKGPVLALSFSPDGKTLATGSFDGTARLWDAGSGEARALLRGHTAEVKSLAFSSDSRTVATGSNDGTVRLWDVESGQPRAPLQGLSNAVDAVTFAPNGKTVTAGDGNGSIASWEVATRQLRMRLPGSLSSLTEGVAAVNPDGTTLAAGMLSGTILLWDLAGGQLKGALHADATPTVIAFSHDSRTLAVGDRDRRTRVWDLTTGQLKATLAGHQAPITALAFSPDGALVATGSQDRTVRIWDVASGTQRSVLSNHRAEVSALAFSPDGRTLATGASIPDQRVRLWDTDGGQLKSEKRFPAAWLLKLAFSPDGKWLATGHDDGKARVWEAETGQLKAELPGHPSEITGLAFSSDGKWLATRCRGEEMQTKLWEVQTGNLLPFDASVDLALFPPSFVHPVTTMGPAVRLHSPYDGRVQVTMLPVPEVLGTGLGKEWLITTPEGYFDCSANAPRYLKWNVNGVVYSEERYVRRFRRPTLVRKALLGQRVEATPITHEDIPPACRFVGLKDGDSVPVSSMTVTIEATGYHDVKTVELLVNERPLAPEQARPIELGARPIEHEGQRLDPNHRLARRFTFRLSLPSGDESIRLRALAHDDTDLVSDPVEVVLHRAAARSVAGNLYVLAVGVSRYKNADGKGFKNLEFPAADARAIVERFKREGKPLYGGVQVRPLINEQATATNLRAGLKWLQASARPGQLDTVVIFLSGHGVSRNGKYYFATHETDLNNLASTTISGQELRQALGGALRAKAVFLFVDTCHSGGLPGRSDDLVYEVGEGVYLMASTGAKEYSYESPAWGHGAFTLGLLHSLGKKELARNGVIHFGTLAASVSDEVAELMKAAGRNESEQEPCVPLASRRLRMPIAQAAP